MAQTSLPRITAKYSQVRYAGLRWDSGESTARTFPRRSLDCTSSLSEWCGAVEGLVSGTRSSRSAIATATAGSCRGARPATDAAPQESLRGIGGTQMADRTPIATENLDGYSN